MCNFDKVSSHQSSIYEIDIFFLGIFLLQVLYYFCLKIVLSIYCHRLYNFPFFISDIVVFGFFSSHFILSSLHQILMGFRSIWWCMAHGTCGFFRVKLFTLLHIILWKCWDISFSLQNWDQWLRIPSQQHGIFLLLTDTVKTSSAN